MATDVTRSGNHVQIMWSTAATDMDFDTVWPDMAKLGRIKVKSITIIPGGADTIIIRDGSLTGPVIMHVVTADTKDARVKYFGEGSWVKPYMEHADQTYASLTATKVIFELC
jgi:hypothetical protein